MNSCLKSHLYYFQVSKMVSVSMILVLGKYLSILWVRATNEAMLIEKVTFSVLLSLLAEIKCSICYYQFNI